MFRHRKGWRHGIGGGSFKECICPNCKTVIPNNFGIPCFQVKCPKCNMPMMARLQYQNIPERR